MKKLLIELVPSTSWLNNLRKVLTKSSWDKIRLESYKKANYRCEICGGQGLYGKGHPVECHEIWSYDEINHIQKLDGVISLCILCHRVKHFGYSSMRGYTQQCKKHLMHVNSWSLSEVNKHINESFILFEKRSQWDWQLDLSWLKDKDIKFKK